MERQSFMMTETEPGTHGEGPACFMQGREGPFAQQAAVMLLISPRRIACRALCTGPALRECSQAHFTDEKLRAGLSKEDELA